MARVFMKPPRMVWTLLSMLFAAVFAVSMASQSPPANSASEQKTAVEPQKEAQPAAGDPKVENSPAATPEQQRQAEIEAQTKKLYQLTAELRAEVAKTYKESLSLTVLKKAEEVEKLAKSLKILMAREATAER